MGEYGGSNSVPQSTEAKSILRGPRVAQTVLFLIVHQGCGFGGLCGRPPPQHINPDACTPFPPPPLDKSRAPMPSDDLSQMRCSRYSRNTVTNTLYAPTRPLFYTSVVPQHLQNGAKSQSTRHAQRTAAVPKAMRLR